MLLCQLLGNRPGSYPTKLAFGNDLLKMPAGVSQPGYSYCVCVSLADLVFSSPYLGGKYCRLRHSKGLTLSGRW